MKKLLLALVPVTLMVMSGCNGGLFGSQKTAKDSVMDLATKCSQFIKSNNVDSIKAIYQGLDSLDVKFANVDGEITVQESNTPGEFEVKMGSATITVKRNEAGQWIIDRSQGLLLFDQNKMAFARKTGQYKDGLPDLELAQRMNDAQFDEWLKERVLNDLKKRITAKSVVNDMESAVVTVVNNSEINLDGDDYTVKSKLKNYWSMYDDETGGYESGYMDYGTKTFSGKPVPAHSSVSYSFNPMFGVKGGDVNSHVSLNISAERAMTLYTPSGNEYEEYLNSRK